MDKMVRVRFAPSPTGYLHVGNVRTALFNWFFARHYGGVFIIRIEDTDRERSSRTYEDQLMEDMHWLGLDWDEGVDVGGNYGPYRQTERLEIYKKYAQKLIEKGKAYYCFCTKEELEAEKERQRAKGETPRYNGKCRNLDPEEASRRAASGEKAVVRLKVPNEGHIIFNDLVFGENRVPCSQIDDRVLLRTDGLPTYNYAVVIDDFEMQITHVLRGEQHLSNTPVQVLLYDALGIEPPAFGHLSTINGPDGKKLSKRHGATSIMEFRKNGYLPQAIVNYLALLGWSPPGSDEEILEISDIVKRFSLKHVSRSPAIFDMQKLNWINRTHMKKLNIDELTDMVLPFFAREGLIAEGAPGEQRKWLEKVVEAYVLRVDTLAGFHLEAKSIFDFDPGKDIEDSAVQEILSKEEAKSVISTFFEEISKWDFLDFERYKESVLNTRDRTGAKGKNLFRPIRVALTARASGPDLEKLVVIFDTGSRIDLPRPILSCKERVKKVLEKIL